MRELLASKATLVKEAVDLFVYRICREIGALVATLGGLDGLVFTAGIGEHSPEIRRQVCEGSRWLGVRLNSVANESGAECISTPDSPVSVWAIATDEERTIVRHTIDVLGLDPASPTTHVHGAMV
jgi:acetate kinase